MEMGYLEFLFPPLNFPLSFLDLLGKFPVVLFALGGHIFLGVPIWHALILGGAVVGLIKLILVEDTVLFKELLRLFRDLRLDNT